MIKYKEVRQIFDFSTCVNSVRKAKWAFWGLVQQQMYRSASSFSWISILVKEVGKCERIFVARNRFWTRDPQRQERKTKIAENLICFCQLEVMRTYVEESIWIPDILDHKYENELAPKKLRTLCCFQSKSQPFRTNKTNDLILNLTPENVAQHSRIVTTTHKGSSTPAKMSKIIGRQIH